MKFSSANGRRTLIGRFRVCQWTDDESAASRGPGDEEILQPPLDWRRSIEKNCPPTGKRILLIFDIKFLLLGARRCIAGDFGGILNIGLEDTERSVVGLA